MPTLRGKRHDAARPLAEAAASSFARGDPNQRFSGFFGRFFRPALFCALGALTIVLGHLWHYETQLTRVGVTLLIIGVLWTVAVGFALGTLRLASAVMLVVIVFLLTGVGGDVRRAQDADDYVTLRNELEVEFNLLRGARTTRADVAERLLASAASQIEGVRIEQAASVVLGELDAWIKELSLDDERKGVANANRDYIVALQEQLTSELGPTRGAIETGWAALEWSGPGPFDATDRIDAESDAVTDDDEISDDSTTEIDTADGRAAPAADDRGDQVADAAARNQMDLAEKGAGAIDAAVDELTQTFYRFGYAESADEAGVGGSITIAPEDLEPPPTPAEEASDDPRCREVVGSASFEQIVARANDCVAGCSGSQAPCEPQTAKRLILLGFQTQVANFTENEDVGDGQQQLVARLSEIQGELDEIKEPVAIHELAIIGADELLGDLVRALVLDDQRPARLGGWGWLLLTVAAIVGYRLLEVANDRRSPSPVIVVAGESSKDSVEKTAAAAALVRSHLGAASLREPSPLPGGEAVSSVSANAESAGFENAVVRYVVSLLQNTLFPRRGVELIVTAQPAQSGLTAGSGVGAAAGATADGGSNGDGGDGGSSLDDADGEADEPDAANDPERYRLMVRASTPNRKGLVFSHPFEGETLQEVTKAAAYFAAERLLDAGWTTPSWLIWSSQDGTALRAYQQVMLDKANPDCLATGRRGPEDPDRPSDRAQLREAVRASPGTGAALVALSHEEVLERELTPALHHLLLARVRHKRFLTVRYRLGVTLSMMANQIQTHWDLDKPSPEWPDPAVAGAMYELRTLAGAKTLPDRGDVDRWKRLFLDQSIKELRFVERSVRLPVILWRIRRQAEREYWLGLARSSRRRRGLAATAMSARALAERRREHLRATAAIQGGVLPANRWWQPERYGRSDRLLRRAIRLSRDDWLVRYNAACFSAARAKEYKLLAEDLDKVNPDRAQFAWSHAHSHRDDAFDQLRRARYARNGQQLSIDWALVDPDLQPLRGFCANDAEWLERLKAVFDVDPAGAEREDDLVAPESSPGSDPTIVVPAMETTPMARVVDGSMERRRTFHLGPRSGQAGRHRFSVFTVVSWPRRQPEPDAPIEVDLVDQPKGGGHGAEVTDGSGDGHRGRE